MPSDPQIPGRVPRSTYRLQLNREFTFSDARELLPYLAELGASDLYASPYLQARAGSAHGYDIIDHNALNAELGPAAEHDALVRELRERGMGHVLDIVPNHMGIGTGDNHRWQDVLENGPSSPHAPFFDIDWQPLQQELHGKVLLPVLGDQFGRVLEAGELRLVYDDGYFRVHYYDQSFPVAPKASAMVLREALRLLAEGADHEDPARIELESIVTALEHLPPRHRRDAASVAERRRENLVTRRRLAALRAEHITAGDALDSAVEHFNGTVGEPRSFDLLETLLDEQAYRLAYWRVAAEEINYRRFFDINELAGVRVEVPHVFEATHRLILDLVARGSLTGLRIDHPDGLYDPRDYLRKLQQEASRRADDPPLYIVVEKILTGDEELPDDWPVAGSVGYEMLNRLNGLFVASHNEPPMTDAYARFIGRRVDFDDLIYERKKLILRVALVSELNVLAHQLDRLSERNRLVRDFTLNSLRDALREMIACFPVYRTYVDAHSGRISDGDHDHVQRAARTAKRRNRATSASVFNFVADVLLLRWPQDLDEEGRDEHARFVMKFQQLTGPVMAKGVEDTAFYIYNRLVSLNEVGGEPERFGQPPGAFHTWLRRRQEQWPHAMNTTSTHDTKRSEDVRARINVLSEIPDLWEARVTRWAELNREHRTVDEGLAMPDLNDEYLLYQTLVGAWPLGDPAGEEHEEFVDRIQRYMEKATREAKTHTSWINPNEEYDDALKRFIGAILKRDGENEFLSDIVPFQQLVARFGMLNSLAQTLVKLTCPGVPDVYRGQEIWDFSLVDPDNRRPVDFARRAAMLAELQERANETDPGELATDIYQNWRDGRAKMWVTMRALGLRRDWPDVFERGEYLPLDATGEAAAHVFAFARRHEGRTVVVAVPRLCAELRRSADFEMPTAETWRGTRLVAPEGLLNGEFRNLMDGEAVRADGGIELEAVFGRFPVGLLVKDDGQG